MAYEQLEGRGVCFRNDKKDKDSQPDFRGEAKFNGELIELAIWQKETSKGAPMLSVAIKAKQGWVAPKKETAASNPVEDDLDIPF